MSSNNFTTGCETCDAYVDRRLASVLRTWHAETGRKVSVARFMAGVHARHESGLPVLVEATS